MGGRERARPARERADAAATIDGGEKLADRTNLDVPGHRRAWEDHGKHEKLKASLMEGSEGATTAWWRSCARYGGLAHR